ncbi:MAG TPA: cell division protein FtsA [Azospirillaceae bacterium]|nr:cell division protein FtsA [Azospirillaceae bacterium]
MNLPIAGVRKPRRTARGGVIAALDVGTTKVSCLIARVDEHGQPRVAGVGHQMSHGVRAGAIVDMDEAEAAIGAAVQAAEQMAQETIRSVVVNMSGGRPTSQTIGAEVGIGGREVTDADMRRAMQQTRQMVGNGDTAVIHSIPIGFSLDGAKGIRDPRGMVGDRLGVQLHLVTAAGSARRNLSTCVARCHLEVEQFVVSPYAAGLAALVEDEMDLGVTLVDMGGGTTSIAVFLEGNMVFADTIPVGGAHVTSDIARGLTTSIAHAERMKTLYGHAMTSPADERETITVPQVGEDDETLANQVPKSLLVGIIQPRLEEIFELVRHRLEQSGFSKAAGRRVVLTGGASQLPGTRELAQLILDKQVRLGRPLRIKGLADSVAGPAFATAAGLIQYAVMQPLEIPAAGTSAEAQGNLLSRVGQWLRENL